MSGDKLKGSTYHGWKIYVHPVLLLELEALSAQVKSLRLRDPSGFSRKNSSKRLVASRKLILDTIPQNPVRPEYRPGKTLGSKYTHWFRAKFFQQCRLFFRYHSTAKIIVFAWVNDEESKRACESRDDAYLVFRKMLDSGTIPDNWGDLLDEAQAVEGSLRFLAGEE